MSPEIWNPEFKVTCANVTFESGKVCLVNEFLWKILKQFLLEPFKTAFFRVTTKFA